MVITYTLEYQYYIFGDYDIDIEVSSVVGLAPYGTVFLLVSVTRYPPDRTT